MTRTVEQVPPAAQPQMEGSLADPVEMDSDTTLEEVEDNPGDTQISRRVLPKRRASTDQAPGPRTAMATPAAVNMMVPRTWSVPETAIQRLGDCHNCARNRRPQPNEEEDSCAVRDCFQSKRFTMRRSHPSSDAVVNREDSGNYP